VGEILLKRGFNYLGPFKTFPFIQIWANWSYSFLILIIGRLYPISSLKTLYWGKGPSLSRPHFLLLYPEKKLLRPPPVLLKRVFFKAPPSGVLGSFPKFPKCWGFLKKGPLLSRPNLGNPLGVFSQNLPWPFSGLLSGLKFPFKNVGSLGRFRRVS